jgi:hypothetical protein
MRNGKSLYDYLYMSRRYTQIRRVMLLSDDLVSTHTLSKVAVLTRLRELNASRQAVHEGIGELNSSCSAICADCGLCCLGNYDHYSSVDYAMRVSSEAPLQSYAPETAAGLSFRRLLLERCDSVVRRVTDLQFGKENRTGCMWLQQNGCVLSVADRPIRCVAFTCGVFRSKLDNIHKREYALLLGKLYKIVCQTYSTIWIGSQRDRWIQESWLKLTI